MNLRRFLPDCLPCGSMATLRVAGAWLHGCETFHLYRPVCVDCGSEGDLILVPSDNLFPVPKGPLVSLVDNLPRNLSTMRLAAEPSVVVPFASVSAT